MRKPVWIIPILFLIAAIGAPVAHADTVTFNISGGDTGTFTIMETSGVISAITGTFDGATISGLIAATVCVLPGPSCTGGFGGNDNVYTGTSPYFDPSGVSFTLATKDTDGFIYVNLSDAANLPTYAFGSCQGNVLTTCNGVTGFSPPTADTIAMASVPEPRTSFLLSLGLLGLIGMTMLRRRKVA